MISNSFGLEAKAQNFIHIKTLSDLSVFDSIDNKRLLILGAGTNVILGDYFNGTVVEVCFNDIEINDDYISVGAGVDWADLIEYCLINKLYGIENLTHIPGSVGAAPVQNIGAYGVEISSFINSIECFNLKTKKLETLNNDQCEFKYRDSIFKLKDFVILKVNFIFNESFKPILSYPALSNFLKDNAIDASSITPRMLSESVKEIRNSKLPDPKITPNVGSIFKNPIVPPYLICVFKRVSLLVMYIIPFSIKLLGISCLLGLLSTFQFRGLILSSHLGSQCSSWTVNTES